MSTRKTPESGIPTPDAAAEHKGDAEPLVTEQFEKSGPEFGRENLTAVIADIADDDASPDAALAAVASFDANAVKANAGDIDQLAEEYGLAPGDLDPQTRDTLAAYWQALKDARGGQALQESVAMEMEYKLREALREAALDKIDRMVADLGGSLEGPDLEARLRDVMGTVGTVAENYPVDEDHEEEWRELSSKFRGLVALRQGTDASVQDAFEKVLTENADVVENGFAAAQMMRRGGDVEKTLMLLYGRGKEEQEKVKERNRREVADLIVSLRDKPLDLAALEALHAANNRNIVPKDVSKIRAEGLPPTFFERIGLMPDDLKKEMEDVMAEANRLRASVIGDEPGQISKEAYAMRAAQLHNDVLDMHPFSDRNGSTALAFLETLMTKVGYVPPATREPHYAKNVYDILGGNETAMAILWEEQKRMATEPGYFVGESNQDEKKREFYDRILNMNRVMSGKPPVQRKE